MKPKQKRKIIEAQELLSKTLSLPDSNNNDLPSVIEYVAADREYWCKICCITANNLNNIQQHLEGQKHIRRCLKFSEKKQESVGTQKKIKIEVNTVKTIPVHIKENPIVIAKAKNVRDRIVVIPKVEQEETSPDLPLSVATLLHIQKELQNQLQKLNDEDEDDKSKVAKEEVPSQQLPETIPLKLPLRQLNRIEAPSTVQQNKMATQLKLFLDLDNKPDESFVGVEYLVEMHMYDQEPRYHCVLCDKAGDPRTIIFHLSSLTHRMKYFDKHYPTLMKELGEFRYDNEARVAVIKVLEEVSMAVQKHHGRLQPLVVEENLYKGADRMRCLQQIVGGKHFSELMGPSFVNLIDKKKIENITRTVKLKADVKRTVAEVEAARQNSLVEKPLEKRLSGAGGGVELSRRSFRSRSRSRSRSPLYPYPDVRRRERRRSPSPDSRRRRSRSPLERRTSESEVFDKYSSLKATAVKEIEVRYQEYELHAEKHPLYSSEWEAFWNRRYKELQADNKDAATYDYKPEWIAFWIRHLKDLFTADVEAAKREIKLKLGLSAQGSPVRRSSVGRRERRDEPRERERDRDRDSARDRDRDSVRDRDRDRKRRTSVDDYSDSDSRRDRDSVKRNRRDRSPSYRRSSRSPSRSTVQSRRHGSSRSPSLDRRERIRELDRIISRLPPAPSSSREYGYDYDGYKYSGKDRHAYDRDESSSSTGGGNANLPEDDDEPLSVVSVLRILAALEDQLGSMGTKTLDLLAKALAMEKAKANSSDELMMSENNAVFFETIKEKLKGQLITGVLGKSKIGAVKKAIRKIAELLHEVTKKKAEAEKADKEAEATKRTIVIKVAMDKSMIAQRIALALITEKKTDVTPEQLEILINVFFEMLRKSKELNKMVTTQDYIELLEEQKVQSVAEKVDILGIIGVKEEAKEISVNLAPNDDGAAVIESVEILEEENKAEAFTDSDLKTLLQNFRDLSSDEQQHLIKHLKKLESESPERVEKLRRFVNLEGLDFAVGKSMSEELSRQQSRWLSKLNVGEVATRDGFNIPGLNALGPVPAPVKAPNEEEIKVKFDMKKKEIIPPTAAQILGDDDDDEDDYSFDDVVKAASKNLAGGKDSVAEKIKKEPQGRKSGEGGGSGKDKRRSVSPETKQISETHSLIANIMGSLQKKTAASSGGSSNATAGGSGSSGSGGGGSSGKKGGGKGDKNDPKAAAGSLPFYQQQQNSSYNSTYQEQIVQQQQQQQQMQFQNQNMMMGPGGQMMGYDNQQMMYQQQMQGQDGNNQWWPNQNQMQYPNQQQNYYGQYGQQQYPNNGQNNNYGNYY